MAAGRSDARGSALMRGRNDLHLSSVAYGIQRPIAHRFTQFPRSQQERHMSKSLMSLIVVTALLALMPLAASPADAPQKQQKPYAQKPYVVLDKSLSRLRADFNANVGKVRMLYIVGPTCGICLRGMSDLQEAVYSKKGDDPRLVTFVIHVPTLGAHEANVAAASRLIA